jgi:hypothetical protein
MLGPLFPGFTVRLPTASFSFSCRSAALESTSHVSRHRGQYRCWWRHRSVRAHALRPISLFPLSSFSVPSSGDRYPALLPPCFWRPTLAIRDIPSHRNHSTVHTRSTDRRHFKAGHCPFVLLMLVSVSSYWRIHRSQLYHQIHSRHRPRKLATTWHWA